MRIWLVFQCLAVGARLLLASISALSSVTRAVGKLAALSFATISALSSVTRAVEMLAGLSLATVLALVLLFQRYLKTPVLFSVELKQKSSPWISETGGIYYENPGRSTSL